MKNENHSNWQKYFLPFSLFAVFLFGNAFKNLAQSIPPQPGITLTWDKEVGCQTYREIKENEESIFMENIGASDCIRFCENSVVNYALSNIPPGAVTTWNVVGGSINSSSATSCSINWGAVGAGSLSLTTTNGSSIITKSMCIEKVVKPTALFDVAPGGVTLPFQVCTNQLINFINLSTTNSGTNLVSYFWDFGDGYTSTEFQPSHAYASPNTYFVQLTVKNECNCTDVYKIPIEVLPGESFEFECTNTLVCEGQSAVYKLPDFVQNACNGTFNWSVVGGHILTQSNGQVEILWDNVDQYGFGYVTFDPSPCGLGCSLPVTFKVPVIQTNGTIQGPTDICLGEDGRFKLPQWPTTEIDWVIDGNVSGTLGTILQTDQRNEVIVRPLTAGTIVLRAIYTNTLLNCSGEAEFTINVGNPLIVSGESVICQNTTETYSNSAGIPVNWTLTNVNGTVLATQTSVSFNYSFVQAGNFILTAEQTGYCAGEQKTITVIAAPSAPSGISGDLLVCPGSPYSYTVQSPNPSANYSWNILPANGSIIGSDVGNQINATFSGTFPANLNVYSTTLTPIECLSPPYTITINQIPINAVIASPQPFSVCANSLATFSANLPGTSTPHSDGDTYTWSFANSNSTVAASSLGSVTQGQGTNTIDVTWNNVTVTTTLDLVLTISKCNINTQFTQQITLYPTPEIEVVASVNSICSGPLYPVTFTVQSTNGVPITGASVNWNVAGITSTSGTSITTPLSNPTASNVGQMITAVVNTNCGVSNTATVIVTVLPNPPAVATLTSPANSFCTLPQVNATITASTNSTGISYQWFHNGITPISGATSNVLNVTPTNFGIGSYTVHTTNPNSCISISNPVGLYQIPCPQACVVSQSLTNTSYLSGCGEITLVGSASGSPSSQYWSVLGVSPADYTINYTTNVLTGIPGNYKIIYNAVYPCTLNGVTSNVTVKEIIDVVIPYQPDFSYVVECTGTNTFHVDLIDNSNFYTPVMPKNMRFYYKAPGATSFTGPIAYNPATGTGNFELTNLTPGNYVFRQEVDGYSPVGMTCDLEYNVNLQGINPMLDIIHTSIPCHNTAVEFDLSPFTFGLTTFWDFDDAGAQNTMTTPSRVFTLPDHTYNVTCEVTNQFGCSKLLTEQVYIPKECFFGDIVSSPSPAEVCQGQTVTLTYVPNGDNCAATSYTWMNGNIPVAGPSASNSLVVTTTGFYWVKVQNAAGCVYASPTQIKPLFKSLPNLKLLGESTYCEDSDIKFQVSTNGVTIEWFLNGSLQPTFNNLDEADFTGLLSVGNYTLTVETTSAEGCVNSVSLPFSVVAPLNNIAFDVSYHCDPYQVMIGAIPNPTIAGITYNWSNGESTQYITVPDGGPYKVTASIGGCSVSAEVDIPKNPIDYAWIFPTGCYTDCRPMDNNALGNYLVGPTLSLPSWSWNQNGGIDQMGTNSFQTSYNLINDGTYTTTINTGPCETEVKQLEYTTKPCERCEIKAVDILHIQQSHLPYCSWTYTIDIQSAAATPFQATISDNFGNVIILPSSITINPGSNVLQFTVIPQSPFTNGTTQWTIQGSLLMDGEYVDCIYNLKLNVPECSDDFSNFGKMLSDTNNRPFGGGQLLNIFPNPASDQVVLKYNLPTENAEIEIVDLAGRSMGKHALSAAKGELNVITSTFQSGMYMVIVKQNDAIIWQQKLVIE